MSVGVRRERWRVSHARLIAQHRAGGEGVSGRRLRVPVYRGGQGRPVEVSPTDTYTRMTWDACEQRVRDLLAYAPKDNARAWAAHSEIVRDLVLRTDYFDRLRDRHLAGTLHRFFAWAARKGFSTEPASLLSGDRIDLFVKTTYRGHGSHSTHRWRLRHIAATVFPPPPEAAAPRAVLLSPHTVAERQRFLDAADLLVVGHKGTLQTRQALYRDVRVVLALTFGAGCNGRSVHRVREGWLRRDEHGVWLDRPDREVPTPITEPWASILLNARTGDPEAWFVAPDSNGKERNEQVGKVFFRARNAVSAFRGFDCDRAARRWHVDVLDRAHFADLVALLGYKPGSHAPIDLAAHLEPSARPELLDRVRGWVA